MSLKIVSLNAWRGALLSPLLDYLKNEDADIYCLQEVLDYPEPLVLQTESSSGLGIDVQLGLVDILRREMPGHQCFFHPATFGNSFDDTVLTSRLYYGNVTLVRNGIPVIDMYVNMVHDRFRLLQDREFPTPRNAACFRVMDPNGGSQVIVAQMHGLWIEEGKGDTPERKMQANRFADIVKGVARSPDGEKIVVCGDFNLMPSSETFSILECKLGVKDLVTSRGFTDTRTSFYRKPERHADYLLVSERVRVDEFNVLEDPEVSDHRPLRLVCR